MLGRTPHSFGLTTSLGIGSGGVNGNTTAGD
jgi:hypothetical protein